MIALHWATYHDDLETAGRRDEVLMTATRAGSLATVEALARGVPMPMRTAQPPRWPAS